METIFLLREYILYGFHDECKSVVAVGEMILRQGCRVPAVDAAEAELCLVNQEIGVRYAGNFGSVHVVFLRTFVEALDAVVEGRC